MVVGIWANFWKAGSCLMGLLYCENSVLVNLLTESFQEIIVLYLNIQIHFKFIHITSDEKGIVCNRLRILETNTFNAKQR